MISSLTRPAALPQRDDTRVHEVLKIQRLSDQKVLDNVVLVRTERISRKVVAMQALIISLEEGILARDNGTEVWKAVVGINANNSGVSSNDSSSSLVDLFYLPLAMSIPEAVGTAVSLSVIMLGTLVGNVLVILSVFTYRPLRNAQNMFIVSLAVADITVAMFVMPFNVAYSIMGRWIFGLHVCEMWLTCDVLCCTASILNLCAIALDRYWAIHDPIRYGQKRTLNRVLTMIGLVWVASALISIPPLVGWNDWPETFDHTTPCKLTEEPGYIIYSSSGSFYIPLVTMTIVYFKIFEATKNRLRKRTKAAANLTCNFQLQRISSDKTKTEIDGESVVTTAGDGKVSVPCPHHNSNSPTNRLSLSGQDDAPSFASNVGVTTNGEPSNINVYLFVEQKQKISLSKERRAARILGIVMGVFVICWLPFFLMYVILPFCESCYISNQWVNFITWLGYVNSGLNPIIYTIFNLDFRKAFARLLCGTR